MSIRRINFWGGPGAGKTSTASRLHGEMKARGYRVHYSEETVNAWIYQGRVPPEGYDDLLLFAQQVYSEELRLNPRKAGAPRPGAVAVDYVVTDCPPLMCCIYNRRRQVPYFQHLLRIALDYEVRYPALHIFLNRPANFDQRERFHTRKQAENIDRLMIECLAQNKLKYRRFDVADYDGMLQYVLDTVGPPNNRGKRATRSR
jgi:hypothetical protein